jgi:hypothetical protein
MSVLSVCCIYFYRIFGKEKFPTGRRCYAYEKGLRSALLIIFLFLLLTVEQTLNRTYYRRETAKGVSEGKVSLLPLLFATGRCFL